MSPYLTLPLRTLAEVQWERHWRRMSNPAAWRQPSNENTQGPEGFNTSLDFTVSECYAEGALVRIAPEGGATAYPPLA